VTQLGAAAVCVLVLAAPGQAAVDSAGGFKYVTKRKQLEGPAAPAFKTFSAPCPPGTHVYGGGHYNNLGFGAIHVPHSGPYDGGDDGRKPDDGWRAVFRYEDAVRVSAYAICARPAPSYSQKTATVPAAVGSDPGGKDVRPRCPGGESPISGGSAGPNGLRQTASIPDPVAGRWILAMINQSHVAREVRATAVCSSKPVSHEEAGPDSVAPGTQGSHAVECPAGTHVVGGGQNYSTDGQMLTAASRPLDFAGPADDGWQTWVDNHDTIARGFFAHATCAEPLP
jgi:hypothetical protein